MRFQVQILEPFETEEHSLEAKSYKEAADAAVRVHYSSQAWMRVHRARRNGTWLSFSSNIFYVPEIKVRVKRCEERVYTFRASLEEIK